MAELEAKLTEAEFSNLLLKGDLSPSRALNALELTPEITSVTSSFMVPAVSHRPPRFQPRLGEFTRFPHHTIEFRRIRYDELLQRSNVVAFNHNDDYNKQIAVRENDIVYILAPVT